MKRPKEIIKTKPRWAVFALRGKRAERIGLPVTARTSDEAIERAAKEYDVPLRERWRLSAQRERER